MNSIPSGLFSGNLVLLDGGMGQELLRRGMPNPEHSLWSANALLEDPELVQTVHEDFLRAGADIITTNTYATPRERLEGAGLGEQVEALNRQAGTLAERAREAVGRDALIAGSLPPIRGSYRPDRVGAFEEIEPQYREQAQLLAPYVDLFICETMSTPEEARASLTGAASTGLPVLVSYTIADHESTDEKGPPLRNGQSLTEAVQALSDLPARAILFNCSFPESISAAIPSLRELTDLPIGAYGNAFTGIPEDWDEHADALPEKRKDLTPDAYAEHARHWIDAGAEIVGGCCEVGPEHIARLRTVLDDVQENR